MPWGQARFKEAMGVTGSPQGLGSFLEEEKLPSSHFYNHRGKAAEDLGEASGPHPGIESPPEAILAQCLDRDLGSSMLEREA